MRYALQLSLIFALFSGCATASDEDLDEEIAGGEEEDEEEQDGVAVGEEEEDLEEPEETSVVEATNGSDCDDQVEDCEVETPAEPNEDPVLVDVPDPIPVFEPEPPTGVTQATTQTKEWTPTNDRPPPSPVSQADLRMACRQIGAGLNSGFVRFGCKAVKQTGEHYGVVKGWWQILRRDGARAKSKDLNFREAGFDMAFDVLAADARSGIVVRPGVGEQAPRR